MRRYTRPYLQGVFLWEADQYNNFFKVKWLWVKEQQSNVSIPRSIQCDHATVQYYQLYEEKTYTLFLLLLFKEVPIRRN